LNAPNDVTDVVEAPFPGSDVLGAGEDVSSSDWVVVKFGGSALAGIEDWQTLAGIVANRRAAGLRVLLVQSALPGVTAALADTADLAAEGRAGAAIDALEQSHAGIAGRLGLPAGALLDAHFEELRRLVAAFPKSAGPAPRERAGLLAVGELIAARLCAAWLERKDLGPLTIDARDLLLSDERPRRGRNAEYLSALCGLAPGPALAERLGEGVTVTQGYIARNASGETVLLGREGSDTSAACLAAGLGARRVEIWTDVPGMFSADPRLVPAARLLNELQYDEARELASTGSRVLHPRSIDPLRAHSIPLFIRSVRAPAIAGTVVSAAVRDREPRVKGISARRGVTLVSMESSVMWQEAGFLADAFAVFARHGISVDLVSTSETNVTVSLDRDDGLQGADGLASLVTELEALCRVRLIRDCAAVSLVGRRIRSMLPRLAPALSVFDEERVHLVSQAANDLNFSLVVDDERLERLLKRFHEAVIGSVTAAPSFGPTWESLERRRDDSDKLRVPWWTTRRDELIARLGDREHAFIYDRDTVRAAGESLLALESVDRVLYAMKANWNADVLRTIAEAGVDFECVSPGEVEHLRRAVPGIGNDRILLTPNFAPRREYEWALAQGLQLTLDNLYPLRAWPGLFRGRELFIRIDPGEGRGHHEHVRTGGRASKFGVPLAELDELEERLHAAGAEVIGIHAHSGSGILDPDNWRHVAEVLAGVAARFPQAKVLDLGGGLGVPDRARDAGIDLAALDGLLAGARHRFPGLGLWLEPGRYLVAPAGVLLARVTQTKGKGDKRYVGISTGMNSLIRPALYGAWHEIVNLTRLHEAATETATVVGPICESGDKLGTDRMLPPSEEGDVLLIANAGAYGRVMGSRYNLREPAEELILQS